MHLSTLLPVLIALLPLASSNPLHMLTPRAHLSLVDTVQYALSLEYLSAALYTQGLANYSHYDFQNAGFADPFYSNLQQMSAQQSSHIQFLQKSLGSMGAAVMKECVYEFSTAEEDGATGFVQLVDQVEDLILSALLGLTLPPTTLPVLTNHARHSAYLHTLLATSPFPSSLDTPLSPSESDTLLKPYTITCPPTNPTLPLTPSPPLKITAPSSSGPVKPGAEISLNIGTASGASNASNASSAALSGRSGTTAAAGVVGAFVTATGPVWFDVQATGEGGGYTGVVPEGVVGLGYVVLNKGKNAVGGGSVVAGPGVVVVGV